MMTKIAVPLTLLATALAFALAAAPAQAQNTYTAVSAAAVPLGPPPVGPLGPPPVGAPPPGPCGSISNPCHTLQAAFNVTANGGEIDVLDPGQYGPLTITHAVSIQGHGWATVTATGGATAITVNAGGYDNINIRGLLLDGVAGSGNYGILFNSGATLHIQDSVIRSFSNGIVYGPNASSQLFVSNTVVSDNYYEGIDIVNDGAGTVDAVLDNVAIENNVTYGVEVYNAVNVMVRNSTFGDNGTGLYAFGQAIIRVTRSTITGNPTGWSTAGGGSVYSYADNNIDNNGVGNSAPASIPYK